VPSTNGAAPRPTNTSTPRPTAVTYTCTNTSGQFCSYPSCQTIGADYGIGTCPSSTSFCCKPKPTNTPTPKNLCPNGSVSVCTGKTIGSSCVNAVAPGMAATCKIMPSSSACTCVTVSTNTPTNTPPTVCKNVGSQCFDPRDCCSGQCSATGSCCLSNGTASKVASNCCSGYLGNDLGGNATVCAPKPTNTPVPTPYCSSFNLNDCAFGCIPDLNGGTCKKPAVTSTPTGATGTCTTISGQWCTAGLCKDKGGTVGVGVCGSGQYCCQPNPTTCVQTGGSCLTGKCCAGNQCIDQGGYPTCYKDSQIPTLFPKLTPAATVTPGTFEQCCPRYDTAYSKNTCTGASENACNINIKYCVPSTSSTCPPYEPGTGPTGGPIVTQPPIVITKPPVTGTVCKESLTGSMLQCCHPPDSDGTSDDSLCNRAGKVTTCGGKDYCCPTLNGNWTTDMTKCNLKCTTCANGKNRSIGDADCNGVVDVNDRSIWASEFVSDGGNRTEKNNWMSDFDCNGVVDVNDRSIWSANFTI